MAGADKLIIRVGRNNDGTITVITKNMRDGSTTEYTRFESVVIDVDKRLGEPEYEVMGEI